MQSLKKSTVVLLFLVGLVVIALGWGVSVSNQMVTLDETVNEKWAQVENVYQRRLDLIPNLVNTVKGYAKHEAQVLEEVTRARAQVGQVKISGPEDVQKLDQSQKQLNGALSRLLVVSENYPELKADRNFLELQSQLEGTENRISVERMRFNEAARMYNSYIRSFPQSMIASSRGFREKAYFQGDSAAKSAPQVTF